MGSQNKLDDNTNFKNTYSFVTELQRNESLTLIDMRENEGYD